MNKLTEEIHANLHPTAALVAYKCAGNDNYYLELRRIGKNGRMGAAKPVPVDFMEHIATAYCTVQSDTPHGPIPERLLYCDSRKGHERYIWFDPPQRRTILFAAALNLENAVYYLPGVIYVAGKDNLKVFAFKGRRQNEKSKLYCAPFFNVSAFDGYVCLGTSPQEWPDDLTYARLLEYWEKLFWLSEFSHLGSGGNPTERNLVLVTKEARERPFDENELKLCNRTLKQLYL